MPVVDVQHHFYLDSYPTRSIEEHLTWMDSVGLDKAVLTNLLPQPSDGNLPFYQKMNQELISIARTYPDRLIPCPSIPIHDAKAARTELERLVSLANIQGALIRPIKGRIDRETLDPFYEKVCELGTTLLVHPIFREEPLSMLFEGNAYHLGASVGFMVDSTAAIGWLIFSGLLERFPQLKLLFHHLGGTAPFLLGRFEAIYEDSGAELPRRPTEYFKRLYFDTVCYASEPLELTLRLVGPDHLLFGTDFGCPTEGLVRPKETVRLIRELSISEEDKSKIFGGNAVSLGVG